MIEILEKDFIGLVCMLMGLGLFSFFFYEFKTNNGYIGYNYYALGIGVFILTAFVLGSTNLWFSWLRII